VAERSEREKMLAGELYDASDQQLAAARLRARQLTRRYNQSREDEGDLSLFEGLHNRKTEGECLAGTRLGDTNEVPSIQGNRDRLQLYRSRNCKAKPVNFLNSAWRKVEGSKTLHGFCC